MSLLYNNKEIELIGINRFVSIFFYIKMSKYKNQQRFAPIVISKMKMLTRVFALWFLEVFSNLKAAVRL